MLINKASHVKVPMSVSDELTTCAHCEELKYDENVYCDKCCKWYHKGCGNQKKTEHVCLSSL